jgi:hypothetical protein
MIKAYIEAIQQEIKERFGLSDVSVGISVFGRESSSEKLTLVDVEKIINELAEELGSNDKRYYAELNCIALYEKRKSIAIYHIEEAIDEPSNELPANMVTD